MKRPLSGEAWLNSRSKRKMDLILATAATPAAAVVTLAAAAGIAGLDKQSPLFKQSRMGQRGKPFDIYKLRTLHADAEDTISNGHDDPRATELGLILRKTRVDEIPQVWNVVMGQMSVVGLRAILGIHNHAILDILNPREQRQWNEANEVCPAGMTDKYTAERYITGAVDDPRKRFETAVEYQHTASFLGDLAILRQSIGYCTGMVRQLRVGRAGAEQMISVVEDAFNIDDDVI